MTFKLQEEQNNNKQVSDAEREACSKRISCLIFSSFKIQRTIKIELV